jgi:hypothetical protein
MCSSRLNSSKLFLFLSLCLILELWLSVLNIWKFYNLLSYIWSVYRLQFEIWLLCGRHIRMRVSSEVFKNLKAGNHNPMIKFHCKTSWVIKPDPLQALLLKRGSPIPQYSIYRGFFKPKTVLKFYLTQILKFCKKKKISIFFFISF